MTTGYAWWLRFRFLQNNRLGHVWCLLLLSNIFVAYALLATHCHCRCNHHLQAWSLASMRSVLPQWPLLGLQKKVSQMKLNRLSPNRTCGV